MASAAKSPHLTHMQATADALLERGDVSAAHDSFAALVEAAPDLPAAWAGLGRCYQLLGKHEHAILVFTKLAREHAHTPAYRVSLATSLRSCKITAWDDAFRHAVLLCLEEENLYHDWVFDAWRACLALAPAHAPLRDFRDGKTPFTALPPEALNDALFTGGLAAFCVQDAAWENALARARASLLDMDITALAPYAPFLAALAQQAFITEYIYPLEARELKKAEALREHIPADENALLLYACCLPLAPLAEGAEFAAYAKWRSKKHDGVAAVLREQIIAPATEARLREGMERIGTLRDATSQIVSAQYEENPYPRWKGASLSAGLQFGADIRHLKRKGKKLEVLVAGCGTGRQITHAVQYFPDAAITAIDLSTASLAFAKRKGAQFGYNHRVRYAQADILDVAALGKTFDVILCTGVLHHMADPIAGWRALCGVAAPGAVMSIALYSDIARAEIIAARALIAAMGWPPTPEGIRACRAHVMAQNDDPVLARLLESPDFYTLSACRDLIFHAQEHRFTALQIKDALETLNLRFLGFAFAHTEPVELYRLRFPADSAALNLENWHTLEQDMPWLFRRMYQFTVCKPDASVSV